MTRINTNVSSLNAQKTLARSNNQLQEALTRLSTGLRINSGKDDPAGLIASETLRSDIVSTQVAVTNSERANQMITTADSALGQVSSLLNDVRGLVSEAANIGAMSSEQIEANQLQVDSSLEAIDRIAQVTQFQGKRLLDGSLDFVTEDVASTISDLQIQQANFGTQTEIAVSVNLVAQAEQGSLTYASSTVSSNVVLEIGGTNGFEAFDFASGSSIAEMASAINLVSDALGVSATVQYDVATADSTGNVEITSVGTNNDIEIIADTTGRVGGDIDIIFNSTPGGTIGSTVTTNADGSSSIEVDLATSAWAAASGTAINLGGVGRLDLVADAAGTMFNDVDIIITNAGGGTATYDHANKAITVNVTIATDDTSDVADAINNDLGHIFTATDNVTGAVIAATYADAIGSGTDGGTITSTAGDVITELNVTNANTAALLTASAGEAATTGAVTAMTDRGFYGTQNTGSSGDLNNYLQFLGPDGSSDLAVQFATNGANQTLSIDLVTNPDTAGMATGVAQSNALNASFSITADNAGEAYSDVSIVFTDDSAGLSTDPAVAAWDPENKTITITGDFDGAVFTAAELVGVINTANTQVSDLFTAAVFGSGDGSGLVDTPAVSGNLTMGTMTGGNQYTGATINLATDSDGVITTTAADLVTLVAAGGTTLDTVGISVSHGGTSTGAGLLATGTMAFGSENTSTSTGYATTTTENAGGLNSQAVITAKATGATYDDIKVNFHHDANVNGTTDEYVTYNSDTKELNIYIETGVSTLNDVITHLTDAASSAADALFSIQAVTGGTGGGVLYSSDLGGTTAGGLVTDTSAQDGIHLLDNHDTGDVLGSTSLTFTSTEYGSSEFVSVRALEGTFNAVDAAGATKTRDSGTDINLRLNGIQAIGDGLKASINTSALDMSFSLDATVAAGTELNFTITEGGAQFQLGPDVVSNQQARMGIASVNTAKLGGTSGKLFMIRSGGDFDLTTDTKVAAKIVEQAITSVTTLRGRLGAFQSTTLQTNIDVLNDTLESLTAAESSIRDADFAAESANLTRAQILVQSGISVLSMANQNPQNVLQLLR